jgi:hypothetical protein
MNARPRTAVQWTIMVRQIVALVSAVGVLLAASLVDASDLRRGSIIPRVGPIVPHGPNIVPNPPPERLPGLGHKRHHGDKDGHDRRHHHGHRHHVRPGFIFVSPPVVYAAPRECVTPGYWAYQWVPMTYTQSTWVPGAWTADGTWREGHYAQHAYASGYYQPYWVPGQTYAC